VVWWTWFLTFRHYLILVLILHAHIKAIQRVNLIWVKLHPLLRLIILLLLLVFLLLFLFFWFGVRIPKTLFWWTQLTLLSYNIFLIDVGCFELALFLTFCLDLFFGLSSTRTWLLVRAISLVVLSLFLLVINLYQIFTIVLQPLSVSQL